MIRSMRCLGSFFAVGLVWAIAAAGPAGAAKTPPYEFDPVLSLTGNCAASALDPVPDPSCPYPAFPNGPSSRFNSPIAAAVDSYGNEYVSSYAAGNNEKAHIDVFDDEGEFVTETAIPNAMRIAVDSKGNLYVFKDNGDVVRYAPETPYEPESGGIEYKAPSVLVSDGISFGGATAVDASTDQLFVTRPEKIERYKAADEGNGLLESLQPAGLGSWPESLAVDGQRRRIYTVTCKKEVFECGVMVLDADAPHAVLKELDGATTPAGAFAAVQGALAIAVDEESGDFFVADPSAKKAYQFNEDYEYLSQISFAEILVNIQIAISNGKRSLAAEPCGYPPKGVPAGDACNRHYLFVPLRKEAGNLLAYHPPGETPPVIESVSTGGIGETEAELTAQIFPGGLDTTYSFELTTQASFEAEGFVGATTAGEGTIVADSLSTEVVANATGLTPGRSYRFRVVASNELGPAEEEGQNEGSFATYDDAPIAGGCPNEALRTGPSGSLPDCRAYELVTPADTSGRPPKGSLFAGGAIFTTLLSNPAGNALYFRIEGGSLPDSNGVGGFQGGDPYVAHRGVAGWSNTQAGPSGEEATVVSQGSESPDQGYSFWTARFEGPAVINGAPTQYVRYPDGHSELVGRGEEGATDPKAAGKLISEGGTHIIFETIEDGGTQPIQLEENAPPTGTRAVYDRTADEVTHVVSLLPNDETPAAGQNASYVGASADGEGIAFEIGGTLYLRLHNQTTYPIGSGVDYAGISEGGGRIFYVKGGDLLAFDVASGEVLKFSETGDVTPVNVATQGTRAYFVSPSVLGGQNPQGEEAAVGKQNLYLSEEGAISFIATVTDRDVEGEVPPFEAKATDGLGLWSEVAARLPAKDPSRTNPSGSVLLFQSRANLTGYPASEFPQVYRYDSAANHLACLSCIPTGEQATGGASLMTYTFDPRTTPPLSPFGFVPNLTPDGRRVFFESTEALVSTDTDGVRDVYEWEEQGTGTCSQAGGCLYLISSGQSERDNFLYAQSTSGDDVFIWSEDALTGGDASGASIYDAKVGGGFVQVEEVPCASAELCYPPATPAPVLPVPPEKAAGGDGNLVPKPKHCPKGKHKAKKNGQTRCVKNKQKKKKNGKKATKARAGTNRGAGK